MRPSRGLFGGGVSPYQYVEIIQIKDMAAFGADVTSDVMRRVAQELQTFADQLCFSSRTRYERYCLNIRASHAEEAASRWNVRRRRLLGQASQPSHHWQKEGWCAYRTRDGRRLATHASDRLRGRQVEQRLDQRLHLIARHSVDIRSAVLHRHGLSGAINQQ